MSDYSVFLFPRGTPYQRKCSLRDSSVKRLRSPRPLWQWLRSVRGDRRRRHRWTISQPDTVLYWYDVRTVGESGHKFQTRIRVPVWVESISLEEVSDELMWFLTRDIRVLRTLSVFIVQSYSLPPTFLFLDPRSVSTVIPREREREPEVSFEILTLTSKSLVTIPGDSQLTYVWSIMFSFLLSTWGLVVGHRQWLF